MKRFVLFILLILIAQAATAIAPQDSIHKDCRYDSLRIKAYDHPFATDEDITRYAFLMSERFNNGNDKITGNIFIFSSFNTENEKEHVLKENPVDSFSVKTDTLLIDLDKFEMSEKDFFVRSVSLWRNQYIINVDEGLLSLSNDLTEISSFPNPEYMASYSEVFVRNDTLMVSSGDEYFEFTEYFDSQECIWKQKEKQLRDPVHRIELNCEDTKYKILYADWGDNNGPLLIFWDKQTNDKHYFNLKMERLINYQNEYFVIGPKSITTIKEYSKSFPKLLFKSTKTLEQNSEIEYVSAFCLSNNLYILGNDEEETFLAQLSGVQLKSVYSFPQRLNFNDKPKFNHVSNQYEDRIILPFFVNDYHNSGFLEIVGNKIHILFLKGISNAVQ